MESIIRGIKICGIASAVPNNWVSLEEQFGSKSDSDANMVKKFIKNTGVEGRYIVSEKQTTSDLCYAAANKLLNEKSIERDKIGVLVFISQTEDYRSPATAMVLHHRLRLNTSCFAFDVNLGCSGFTHGIEIVSSILLNSDADYALLLCGDTSARYRNPYTETYESKLDKMLFGDCGTATLLKKDSGAKDISLIANTNGSKFDVIIVPYEWYRHPNIDSKKEVFMDGLEVYNFSTTEAPKTIQQMMKKNNTTIDNYDCLVLHQANKLIIDRIGKAIGIDDEKNLKSISKYGNTSSASIPATLVHYYGNDDGGEIRCMLCGFGVGLSWSAVDCYIDKKDIISLVYSDECFDDGYGKE